MHNMRVFAFRYFPFVLCSATSKAIGAYPILAKKSKRNGLIQVSYIDSQHQEHLA